MTSVVLSALLTARVLAWWKHFGNIIEISYLAVCVLINECAASDAINYPLSDRLGDQTIIISVLIEAIQRKEEDLTYAQFPISFANILSGMVFGSSFSFPSIIRLKVKEKQRKKVSVKIIRAFKYKLRSFGQSSTVIWEINIWSLCDHVKYQVKKYMHEL